MQCPYCGHQELFDLNFCTACGAYFKREPLGELREDWKVDNTGFSLEREPTYEELRRYTIGGLLFTSIMGFVILLYLLMNGADLVLIVTIETFPAVWFVLILVQWITNKRKVKKTR